MHSRYNALLRRLVSFERAWQCGRQPSPDHFIPVKAGWEERGHVQDLDDVRAMLLRGLVARETLLSYFEAIAPRLYRYPAVDPASVRRAVDEAVRTE